MTTFTVKVVRSTDESVLRPWLHNPLERLHKAIKEDNLADVERAVLDGADVNEANNSNGHTPLVRASRHGFLRQVTYLLNEGATVEASDALSVRAQDQALHMAARHGHLDVANALLAHGAWVDVRNPSSMTPLHEACRSGHDLVAQALLLAGADPHAVADMEKTPLHVATNKAVMTVLLGHGADPDFKPNPYALSAKEFAVKKGRKDKLSMMESVVLQTFLEGSTTSAPALSPRPRSRL